MNAEDYIDNYEDVMAQLTAIDFKKYCQDFIHKQIEVQNELLNKGSYNTFSKYFANNKEFVSKFKDCTFRFRKYIIKCSPKDTSQNLICHSIKKKSIDDYALMFYPDLKFEQFLYKKSWIKYSFSEQNLYKLIFVQLIMQAYHAGEKKYIKYK